MDSAENQYRELSRVSVFIKPGTQIISPQKTMPNFTPLLKINRGGEAVDIPLDGEIKYEHYVVIKSLNISPANARLYPGLPVRQPKQKYIQLKELTKICRALFGSAKGKAPEMVAFLLEPRNLEVIRRNNALIEARERRKSQGGAWNFG